nr:hypothetical protein [Tanacetum cinerariifolium]
MSTIKFAKTHNLVAFLEKPTKNSSLIDVKKINVTKASISSDLQLQDAECTACLPNDTIFEELARMGKIFVTTSLPKKVFANMKREGKGFSGIITLLFDTMMVQALTVVGEGLEVLDLEKAKTAQANETVDLMKRVKKLERKKKSRTSCLKRLWKISSYTRVESSEDKESLGDQEDASKQRRMIDNIDQKEEITLVDETHRRMNEEEMFRVNDLDGDEVIVDATACEEVEQTTKVTEKEVSTDDPIINAGEVVTTTEDVKVTIAATTLQISKDELTLAQTLIEIKAAKPKARGVIVQEPSKFRTTSSLQPSQLLQAKDKEEEERIAREKDEANIAVIEQWNEVQAKIDADMELAQKLQTKEQEQLTDVEKARLLWKSWRREGNSLQERKKLKRGTDHPLKLNKEILFMKRINTFVDININIMEERSKKTQAEVTEGSYKRAGDELEQESAKRQRLEKEDDSAKLKKCLEIVPEDDDDVTIKATPLSSKSSTIVDYKIYKEGKKSYLKIIWAEGRLMKDIYLHDVFGYIPLMKTKLLIKKLEDSEGEH